jgi:histidinol-phosphate aminotransferase
MIAAGFSEAALARRGFAAMMVARFSEASLGQRAPILAPSPGLVWLNANEFPEGPPAASIEAITRVVNECNRYHYEEFGSFSSGLAVRLNLEANNILVGAGSSEVLHCAIEAFVTPRRPLITGWPTFEAGPELTAAKGYGLVKIPLTNEQSFDVEKLAHDAGRAGGGLIYICNPNNPTSSITRKEHIRWLAENLPSETYLLVDEAYIHFTDSPDVESALGFVQNGKNVIVLRTFSKIYGMAGLRVGFAAARPDLIARMMPYRNNVISIVGVRAVLAALDLGDKFIGERRATIANTRCGLVEWCRKKQLKYIEPYANFMMIDTQRNVRELGAALIAKGVAPGRPFPPYDTMVRVTIGSESDVEKFKSALGTLLSV